MRSYTKKALEGFSPVFTTIANSCDDKIAFANQLFELENFLGDNIVFLRAITDPSRDGQDKITLADKVFMTKVSKYTAEAMRALIGMRWPKELDLLTCLEELGVEAILLGAKQDDMLKTVEKELFRVANVIKTDIALRNTLTDVRRYSADERIALADKVFSQAISQYSLALLERAVAHTKRTGIVVDILNLAQLAADHHDHFMATVVVAQPLSQGQLQRLEAILHNAYGKKVVINELVDKSVIGGIRIRIGETIIDGSLLSQLQQLRQRLAS